MGLRDRLAGLLGGDDDAPDDEPVPDGGPDHEPRGDRPPDREDGTDHDDDPDHDPGQDDDPVLDRLAGRAAVEAAAEDARSPAAVAERHREAAADLVDEWPAYDLDFTVESLVRLDALVGDAYDRSGGDREYDGDPLTVPEGTQLSVPTDGSVEAFGGYLAELFRRHHDAAWRVDDEPVLAVEGPAGTAELAPRTVAVACFAGESRFVDAYARVAADAGLEPPLSG